MSEQRCDQPGCELGPLSEAEAKPRFYRLRDGSGPVLKQFKHDACHSRFLVEKKGFEVAEGFVEPPPRPEHEHYGTEADRRNRRTIRSGNATIIMDRSSQRTAPENRRLPLGVAMRARLLGKRGGGR